MSSKGQANHGTLYLRLKPLMERAKATWGIPVSRRMLAKATGISPTTVAALYQGHSRRYDLRTLWKLCWFFNCGIAELLQWLPPPGHAYEDHPIPPVQVGAITLPRTVPADSPAVRISLPDQLVRTKKAVIQRKTGLAENTVAAFLNQEHPPTRLAETTLAALLDVLSQHEGKAVGVATLLRYDPPVCHAQSSGEAHER